MSASQMRRVKPWPWLYSQKIHTSESSISATITLEIQEWNCSVLDYPAQTASLKISGEYYSMSSFFFIEIYKLEMLLYYSSCNLFRPTLCYYLWFISFLCCSLRWCNLTERSCSNLASVLSSHTRLTELELRDNDVQDSGLKLLCAGLQDPGCSLQKLGWVKGTQQCNRTVKQFSGFYHVYIIKGVIMLKFKIHVNILHALLYFRDYSYFSEITMWF